MPSDRDFATMVIQVTHPLGSVSVECLLAREDLLLSEPDFYDRLVKPAVWQILRKTKSAFSGTEQ